MFLEYTTRRTLSKGCLNWQPVCSKVASKRSNHVTQKRRDSNVFGEFRQKLCPVQFERCESVVEERFVSLFDSDYAF